MTNEAVTVTNTTAGLSVNSDYDVAVDNIGGKDYQLFKNGLGGEGIFVHSYPSMIQIVSNDTVEAGSSTTLINATAHAAQIGDFVQMRSGTATRNGMSWVVAKTANSITLSPALQVAPNTADVFSILRPSTIEVTENLALKIALYNVFGTGLDMNSGVKSDATLRVVMATDQPALTNAQPTIEATGLVPKVYDYISLTYTGSDLTTAVYKTGGAAGTTVATLTMTYSTGILQTVTRT